MAQGWSETREEKSRRVFLDKAWHSFVADGVEIEGLSAEILRSWRRARDTFGVQAHIQRCTRLLTPSDLEHRRKQDEAFALAKPVLDEFGTRLTGSEHALAWFDPKGWMLSISGNPKVAERLAAINFCPGANWREESAGTNGPGTALAERRAVEVFASEHFVEAWQSWDCCASPLLEPGTGELLGIVDITGPWTAHDVKGLVMARAIARAVEERVRSARAVRDQVVEYAFRTAPSSGDGLFAVDPQGRVLAANDAARRRLGLQADAVPTSIREVLDVALRQQPSGDADLLVEWPGGLGKVRLAPLPVRYEGLPVGAVVRVLAPQASAASPSAPTHRSRAAPRAGAGAAGGNVARYDFGQILGEARALLAATSLARAASRNDLPVVLTGESGTGKELFAQSIHGASARADGPFVAVNCGCIPAALLEAELFGYEAGTFTGGRKEGNAGKFEEAHGGTLFLDEVSELSPQAQTALLRVLQEREVVRLGGSTPRRVDLRVVAATNKPLAEEIRAGRFRQDLFFRLNVLAVAVPPLRDHAGDVPLLARSFLREAEGQLGRSGLALSPAADAALMAYAWPGNVRELRNVILRSAATAASSVIDAADLPEEVRERGGATAHPQPPEPRPATAPVPPPASAAGAPEQPTPADQDGDRDALLRALEASSWNVAKTAQSLRVSRMTLYRWIRKHGIAR